MQINMKYYVVTIGAIFISIGIGMLVGFNLNFDNELSNQQANIINDLEKEFDTIESINDNLNMELEISNKTIDEALTFISNNVNTLIENKLTGKSIGIISTNQNLNYTTDISETILNAGGEIAFNITIKDNVLKKDKLENASTALGLEFNSYDDILKYITETLNQEFALQKLISLQDLDLIVLNSISENYLNYSSLILTSEEPNKNFDMLNENLIEQLKKLNKYLVYTEKTDTKESSIDLFSKNNITTIDNIDEDLGKLSLILSISSENQTNNFGKKEKANQTIPFNIK